jgi:hypothetical protein
LPERAVPTVLAGGADQGQAQAIAGEEFLGVLTGQALAGADDAAGGGPVRGLAFQRAAGLVPPPVQLRVRQAEPVTVPSQAQISSSLHPQYQRE